MKRFGSIFEDWSGQNETLFWSLRRDRDRFSKGVAPLGYRRVIVTFDIASPALERTKVASSHPASTEQSKKAEGK